MGATTNIEWTDATYNPIGGCSIASPGCTNCYAQSLAGTRLAEHPLYKGTTSPSKAGPVFNGHLTVAPDDHPVWTWPMKWKGAKHPRRGPDARSLIFVGDMSDLFHEDRPDEVIDRVFAVMALCPQHDFQVLTKRAERMRAYIADPATRVRIAKALDLVLAPDWPLPSVWLGVSAERQEEADQRIPHLLATPAAVRFVSAEPLLGPVTFGVFPRGPSEIDRTLEGIERVAAFWCDGLSGQRGVMMKTGKVMEAPGDIGPRIDWIIAGGESGKNARPMSEAWARSIRDQCRAAGTAFFMKQMTKRAPIPDDLMIREFPR